MGKLSTIYNYKAHIDRVVDADTFDATIDLGFGVSFKARLRLAHVNAYETRINRAKGVDSTHKKKGLVAKGVVSEIFKTVDREVLIASEDYERGKYGRVLCRVFIHQAGLAPFELGRYLESRGFTYGK